nr:hypothetical protein [Tanacetum cinerariifolium]
MNSSDPSPSSRPTKVEVPKELPKVSMERGLIIAALKDELRKLKGKDLVDNVVTTHTIAPKMLKINMEPLAPRLLNNMTFHFNYFRLTQEQVVILREVVEQDHLCSACAMGKSKKKPHKPKSEDTNQEIFYLLHMDLCGPMHVTSVNGKKYILVIVDDYSGIDNGTEFVNQTLREYYEKVGISHETYFARSPQQNSVVERRNRTLIEDACTILELALHEMTPSTISSRLVLNPPLSILYVPPLKNDWDLLFQPLFDELLTPPPSVDPSAPKVIALIAEVVAPEPVESTGLPSSTTVNQDAPSPKNDSESSSSDVIPNVFPQDSNSMNKPYFVTMMPFSH